MQQIDLAQLGKYVDAVNDIQTTGMLVSATADGKTNALLATWGALGCLWGRKCAFIFIRPSRYTNGFIEKSKRFTLTFFENRTEAMNYLGSHSGRDEPDKIKNAGLTLTEIDGQPTFEEGKLVLLCRNMYAAPIERENFIEKNIDDEKNPQGNRSIVYVAEIEKGYLL